MAGTLASPAAHSRLLKMITGPLAWSIVWPFEQAGAANACFTPVARDNDRAPLIS
jgi:hypothetical protein